MVHLWPYGPFSASSPSTDWHGIVHVMICHALAPGIRASGNSVHPTSDSLTQAQPSVHWIRERPGTSLLHVGGMGYSVELLGVHWTTSRQKTMSNGSAKKAPPLRGSPFGRSIYHWLPVGNPPSILPPRVEVGVPAPLWYL